MISLPDQVLEEIKKQLRRPRGTVTFNYTSEQLFDPEIGFGIILQIVSGSHLFRIERDNQMIIRFFHSSPGTGTRVAEIDLKSIHPAATVFMVFTWEPENITFGLGPKTEGGQLVQVNGQYSLRQFRIGTDGSIFQIGDNGVDVMGTRVFIGGRPVLVPTALENWGEVISAVKVLLQGTSNAGYIFDVAICNTVLIMLVTGFESYCKGRFIELEQEGVIPNIGMLISSFFSLRQRKNGFVDTIKEDAQQESESFIEYVVDRRSIINFQDYDNAKKAFNKVYRIKFGELGISSQELEHLQNLIHFRHLIVHISPLLTILNQPIVHPNKPVFANRELAVSSIILFDTFIKTLHQSTLKLDRQDYVPNNTYSQLGIVQRVFGVIRKFYEEIKKYFHVRTTGG